MASQSNILQLSNWLTSLLELVQFYQKAKEFCLENEQFRNEVEWQNTVDLKDIDADQFFREYVWVVLCSGFKVAIARQIVKKLKRHLEEKPGDYSVIGNKRKRNAIEYASKHYTTWFKQLKEIESEEKKLEFLEMLSFIGPITKFHLAKNIGLQYAKPDVHLERVRIHFGFENVQNMCEILSQQFGDKIPTVDYILWRFCAEHLDYHKNWN